MVSDELYVVCDYYVGVDCQVIVVVEQVLKVDCVVVVDFNVFDFEDGCFVEDVDVGFDFCFLEFQNCLMYGV